MIQLFAAAEEPHIFYVVDVETELLMIAAYTVSLIVCIAIREFTHGMVRYLLALLFTVSFSVFGYVLISEYSPAKYILLVAIIAGVISGLWVRVGKIIGSITKH